MERRDSARLARGRLFAGAEALTAGRQDTTSGDGRTHGIRALPGRGWTTLSAEPLRGRDSRS